MDFHERARITQPHVCTFEKIWRVDTKNTLFSLHSGHKATHCLLDGPIAAVPQLATAN